MNRDLTLWVGVLAGPVVWLASFEARFALAPWACTLQTKVGLFAVTLVASSLCMGSAALAWKQWKSFGAHGPSAEGGALPRGNFMAIGGIVLSIACLMIVLAQFIPELLLGVCE